MLKCFRSVENCNYVSGKPIAYIDHTFLECFELQKHNLNGNMADIRLSIKIVNKNCQSVDVIGKYYFLCFHIISLHRKTQI